MPRKRKPPNQGPGYANAQPPTVPTGLPYGQGAQLERSQQAMPLPSAPSVATGSGGGPPQQAPGPMDYAMAERPPTQTIDAPTTRPNEPLTTGLASGPGAGPEILGPNTPGLTPGDQMRALYMAYPTPELGSLIAYMDEHA